MNKLLLVIAIITVMVGCNTKKSESEEAVVPADSVALKTDSAIARDERHYFWTSDLDPKQGLLMKKTTPVSTDSLTAANMIARLNETYPEIRLDLVRVSGDSIFLDIKKARYLTQQMGSSGPEAYLGEVTYNLTEVPGINYVNIRFKEGDHASPGTFSRTDFVQVKE